MEPDPKRKRLLERLTGQERRRYLFFWRSLLGRECRAPRPRVSLIAVAYRLVGPPFTLRLLRKDEASVVERYRSVADRLPGELRQKLEAIIRDEEEPEKLLLREFEDARVRHLGYVALGLADAAIEITGVDVGFLGVTADAIMASIAGLVVSLSAAIFTASAAYLQAKHGEESPRISMALTGLSYIVSCYLTSTPLVFHPRHANKLPNEHRDKPHPHRQPHVLQHSRPGEALHARIRGERWLLLGTAIASYIFGQVLGKVFNATIAE